MRISHKTYEEMIRARLEYIEKYTGDRYELDYSSIYGGWRMYRMEGSTQVQGELGNYLRYSNLEMLRYVQGIVNGLGAKTIAK